MFKHKGNMILISGPMYAGKSRQLINMYKKFESEGANQIAFRPSFDTRTKTIESRAGGKIPSVSVNNSEEFKEAAKSKDIIFIDEFQFFDEELIKTIIKYQKKGTNFVISGLDKDFLKENFYSYNELKKYSTSEIKMTAICHTCSRAAKYSRKETNEKKDYSRIELDNGGVSTQYFSSCEICHPRK